MDSQNAARKGKTQLTKSQRRRLRRQKKSANEANNTQPRRGRRRVGKEGANAVVAPGRGRPLAPPIPPRSNKMVPTKWADMMIDPRSTEATLSPTPGNAPVQASVAKFTFTREIAYGDTHGGYFIVLATPATKDPLLLMTTSLRYPSEGNTDLTGVTTGSSFAPGVAAGNMASGWMQMSDPATGKLIRLINTVTIQGIKAFLVGGSSNPTVKIINKNNVSCYMKLAFLVSDVWEYGAAAEVGPQDTSDISAVPSDDYTAIAILYTDSAGVRANPPTDFPFEALLTYSGYIAASGSAGSVGEFIPDELADQGAIQNVRTTAISMLASPIGNWAAQAGRMVMARTLARNIFGSETVADVMDAVEKLNENVWLDVPVTKGAFSWWMPDDSSSYAPHAYGQPAGGDENILILAGRMGVDNSVRVTTTYVVEFYSPKQVFTKSFGPVLDGSYELAYRALLRLPAVSENEGHWELIRKAREYLRRVLLKAPDYLDMALEYGPGIAKGAMTLAALL
jgi:hypothetical protein